MSELSAIVLENSSEKNVLHKTRNGTIDLMRILFTLCIVIHHAHQAGLRMNCGYIGVEFFFIVTGYLVMNKIADFDGEKFEVLPFLFHKLKAFYPEFICAHIIGLIVILYAIGFQNLVHNQ